MFLRELDNPVYIPLPDELNFHEIMVVQKGFDSSAIQLMLSVCLHEIHEERNTH